MTWTEIQQGPAFGLTVVGLLVVFAPLIAERLRVPGLLGLLIGGALIGPNMFDVLPSFDTLDAIGEIGVLYLIFLAGMQLDIESFMRYRRISLGFGLLTAFIPLVLGTAVALWFDIETSAAILIGSFWASFTLITYPLVSRYGLTRNRAVAAIVGASSITDTISLIILALIIGAETGDSSGFALVAAIGLGLVVLAIWCLLVVPWVARWFFTGLGQERTLRFMLVLVGLTSSAVIADLVGIEPLIGAFFVGVGLNSIVPNASPLMSVTDFVGNAFFIPTFLVSVGLLFDTEVMFTWSTLRLAIGFGAALIVGKSIAAWLAGRIFGLSSAEVGLMFSMSVAQAAATLAATIVGLDAGLYGDDIVNAVMVVVAVSLVVTSVGTSRAIPLIPPPTGERRRLGEAVLMPVATDDDTLRAVASVAHRFTEPVGGVVQPLVVVTSTDDDSLAEGRRQRKQSDGALKALGWDVETELRVDRSVAGGLNRAAFESESSMVLLTWSGSDRLRGWLLGAGYSEIVAATELPVVIAALHDGHETGNPVLFAQPHDVVPGHLPSLRLGVEIASLLQRRGQELVVGPLHPTGLIDGGIALPESVRHGEGPEDLVEWSNRHTEPGDLVILPFHGLELRSAALDVAASGRSVIAVTHNPESSSTLGGSTLTLPVGGTLGPA